MPADVQEHTHPRFSIVIPTYNQAQYLAKAIQSVLAQTYQDFEIIVVNNYSTDATVSIVNSFADERIKLINYHNQGVIGAARNRGIEASCGEYVAFLDSDDLWYAKKLEKVNKVLEQHPEADVIGHGIYHKRQDSQLIESSPAGRYVGPLYEHLLFVGNVCYLSATVMKRSVLQEVGMFSESARFVGVEDYDLWLRLAHSGYKFYFMSDLLGENLVRLDSVSSKVDDQYRNVIAAIEHHYRHDLTHRTVYSKLRLTKRIAPLYYNPGRYHHINRRYKQALSYYWKAITWYPLYGKAYAVTLFALLRIRI
jgi:glycosyltransferase involved in cell wall biosynthesis